MPLTFGAATSDVASLVLTSFGNTGQAGLFTGWFYPTTLTAGRYLIAMGANSTAANYGVKVGTTTSTLQLTSTTTTPGLWTATADTTLFPSGIVVNQWHFIAGLVTMVTGPTVAWRMWLGTESIAPTAMTIVQNTAPATGLVAAITTHVGNNGAGSTAAFQGAIGTLNVIFATASTNNIIPIATSGTISTDEQTLIEQTYINPLWLGIHPGHFPRDGATAADWVVMENRHGANYIRQNLSATAATTITRADLATAATVSLLEHPRVPDYAANVRLPPVRR